MALGKAQAESKLSKLQLTRGQWQSGMTYQNHLSTAFLTEPVVSKTISMVFGYKYKNPLTLLTTMMGSVEINNRQFGWQLMGDTEKAVPISVAPQTNANAGATFGLNNSSFLVGFPERYFAVKDVLASDDRTLVRIIDEPYQDGINWMYRLELISSDNEASIAASQVAVGAEFSKEYTALAEYDEGGNTTSATPFELRNHLTTIAKQDAITRSAATDVLVISMPDPENPSKTTDLWTRYREWLFMQQWYREAERLLMYSRYNADAKGVVQTKSNNGLPIYMGAGVQEQIEMGEIREFTKMSEDFISEFITDLSYNRKDMGDRDFKGLSGEYGLKDFHYAMKEALQDWNISDATFTYEGSNMNLTFGSQFKSYQGLNGTKYTPMHMPLYDDTTIHRTKHPLTLKPIESYRHTVIDFGAINGSEQNVTKMYKKDSEYLYWHVAGSISPTGPAKSMNTLRSNARDGYSVHALSECGIRIKNPYSCGEMIYSVS